MYPSQRDGTVAEQILAAAAAAPDTVLLSDRDHALTGGELRDLVLRFAGRLAGLGLGRGDVVAILPTTSVAAVAVRYAAALIGCATAYCPAGSPERAAGFVNDVGAVAVIVLPETAAAASLVGNDVRVITVGEILTAKVTAPPGPPNPSDLGWLVSSGGTTGRPSASRRSFADWSRMVSAPADPTRRQLVCTSLVHVGQVLLDQTLLGGGAVVLRDHGTGGEIDPADVLRTIEAERITHLCLVEPQLVQLVDHPDLERRDLDSLVAVAHIGADAAPSLRLRLLRRLESVGLDHVLAHTYGASELGLVSMLAGADYGTQRIDLLGSVGRPLPGVDVTILRTDETLADPEEEGTIVVHSSTVASGVRTSGDVGYLDTDGYLHVRGRAVDARGNALCPVFPVDVQNALCAHPAVRYAVAVPTDSGFAALVVPMAGRCLSTPDLLTSTRRQHGPRLLPVSVVISNAVPLTEQGKPDRAAIGALFTALTHVA
jgi:fatty-acyl-CoA synthase